MGFFSRLFASHAPKTNAPKTDTPVAGLSEITAGMEADSFVDLRLSLASHARLSDDSQVGVAQGLHKGSEVAFRFRLPARWKQGTLGGTGITTYQSTVVIESVGTASDLFITTLGELYRSDLCPEKMAPSVTFTAISLSGIPAHLENGATQIKLFFEPTEESEEAYELHYAELYLNIDLVARTVEFHEKDEAYRDAILRALSGKE